MIRTRERIIEHELASLAPYAQKSGESAGRKYPEPPAPFRTEYERDCARVIHSRAFRRLEYKTQVFLNGTGDHLRTRMTHTMEVASISRSIARALSLNEDLAEAIALAHDLGHSPFGHSGEEALNECMAGYGGFDHNEQSLRILERLEKKYPGFDGLNLTFEVLEGLQKHRKLYSPPPQNPPNPAAFGQATQTSLYTCPSLEAQIADISDEIAYYSHDLDDGLDFKLITPRQLASLEVWHTTYEDVKRRYPTIRGRELTAYVIRCIIDREVEDVIQTSERCIVESGVSSAAEVRWHPTHLVCYSEKMGNANKLLRKFLYANLYYHPTVVGVNQRACNMLRGMFDACVKDPALLGDASAKRIRKDGLQRAVCDYLAGMTDRYLIEEHARLFDGQTTELLPVSAST